MRRITANLLLVLLIFLMVTPLLASSRHTSRTICPRDRANPRLLPVFALRSERNPNASGSTRRFFVLQLKSAMRISVASRAGSPEACRKRFILRYCIPEYSVLSVFPQE
jgi:hypothetical protein